MNTNKIDLFECIPDIIIPVCEKWSNIEKENGYLTFEDCKNFKLELHEYGYTFDYGLDAIPSYLRKINSKN